MSVGCIYAVPASRYLANFWHVGVEVDDRLLLSLRPEHGYVVESKSEFANGELVEAVGWLATPRDLMSRLSTYACEKPYSLFSWNCEHFLLDLHGLTPRSPQMESASNWALAVGGLAALVQLLRGKSLGTALVSLGAGAGVPQLFRTSSVRDLWVTKGLPLLGETA